MERRGDLTQGDITKTLTKLALPIMGTSLINMLYNLTDIMWLGRLSTGAVAAAGAVGFFTWIGSALMMIARVGGGIGVSQSYGKNDKKEMSKYISNALQLDIFIGLSYALVLYFFRNQLISFFNLEEAEVIRQAENYMQIISISILFYFVNPVISTIFNSVGNSFTPFIINFVGLATNMVLDPLLIFGLGPIPKMGIRGAAVATTLAQLLVTIIFLLAIYKNRDIFQGVNIFGKPDFKYIKRISKWGIPSFLQSGLHASVAMVLARMLSTWGATAIAVQSTGSQIESVSWMTAEGFANALTAFTGQNYGAGDYERVEQGYKKGLKIVSLLGAVVSIAFIFKGDSIFALFTPNDPAAISGGADYLRILGYAQIFVCIEIAAMGTFNGLGRPVIPAAIGVIFNLSRIPLASILTKTSLGVDGVWWSLTSTCMLKGIIATLCCYKVLKIVKKEMEKDNLERRYL